MHDYFAMASNISVPWPKELEFFSSNFSKGPDWYLAHYDIEREIFFEFTPTYHWKTPYLNNIARTSKNNVIIIMLRDPISRSYSAFIHRLYWFFEDAFLEGKLAGYDTTFLDVVNSANQYVMPSYTEVIEHVATTLDPSKTVVIPMESFAADPEPFVHLIEEKIDRKLHLPENAVFPKSNSLAVPLFFRGREILDQNPMAKDLIRELDDVYFCRNGFPQRIAKGEDFDRLKKLEAKWLTQFEVSELAPAFDRYYKEELPEIERLTGLTLSHWGEQKELRPKIVLPLSASAAKSSMDVTVWYARRTYLNGQKQEAMQFIRQAIESEAPVPEYHRLLAWMYLENGEGYKADEQALIALSQAPAHMEYLMFRRYVLNRLQIAERYANDSTRVIASPGTEVGNGCN